MFGTKEDADAAGADKAEATQNPLRTKDGEVTNET
jgi:hypothetical protein